MADADCVDFLHEALPRLGLRWSGFRKVRGQVCKRIRRRMIALGAADFAAYRRCLEARPREWAILESLCRASVSRFWRDRATFDHLRDVALPRLAAEAAARTPPVVRCWSAGCASGEEAYSLALAWRLGPAGGARGAIADFVASDADQGLIARALKACYPAGSLRELPPGWRQRAFIGTGEGYCLRSRFRVGIRFICQDMREQMPPGPFDLVLCRNLAFTYFDDAGRRRARDAIAARLRSGGWLVLGRNERLPRASAAFSAGPGGLPIHRCAA